MAKAIAPKRGAASMEIERQICGVIMPISAIPPEYDALHWTDVRRVLDEAIEAAEMVPQIVSDSFETDVIQRRIVHNLYENPVVVCDVSGLNPNVMFELGMRLTFMKPVVIITDDVKRIPFDTGVIEHLAYPRDLHIHKTQEFIEQLTEKIKSLHAQVIAGKFKSFLETFGKFEVFQPSTESVPADRFIAERLEELTRSVRRLERVRGGDASAAETPGWRTSAARNRTMQIIFNTANEAVQAAKEIGQLQGVIDVSVHPDATVVVDWTAVFGEATERMIDSIIAKYYSGFRDLRSDE